MEGDEIGMVLSRASELRSKINNCIHQSSRRHTDGEEDGDPSASLNGGGDPEFEAQTLLNIRDALESLEDQLASLQFSSVTFVDSEEEFSLKCCDWHNDIAIVWLLIYSSSSWDVFFSFSFYLFFIFLGSDHEGLLQFSFDGQDLQQQQRYAREAALAEIDHSRKVLLKKLKEYKGEDLEVINEASAFASETVEHDDDLLLPPYPSRPPHALVLDNGYPSHLPSTSKFARNGVTSADPDEAKKSTSEGERNQTQPRTRNSESRVRLVINVAAKTVLTLISVISVLSLAGFEPRLGKSSTQFKVLDLFRVAEKRATMQCPPGRVLVMEDGEPRCLVKERVEIPFESVTMMPNVSYGCG
ncbi:hypothetical protein HHK36_003149 [Tetracentron sinense]|uniref:Plastid division protein PDV2 n=1 Tax=Tetracentron sinense TaxID=13715 RepID=A0A834ZXS6_TETSI|nr:hypothetical protein HHK36_003149 [Tetracentron sinense]